MRAFGIEIVTFLCIYILFGFYQPVYSESHIKIIGVAGVKAPDVPLADTSMPDVVLDASLAGEINVDVSTLGVPDGTKVFVKFKDEPNTNLPSSTVESGMSTIKVNLEAGNAKVLFAETGPYIPTGTKSALNGRLEKDDATVALFHLDNSTLDDSGNGPALNYAGASGVQYVPGVSSSTYGIFFDEPQGTERVFRNGPYGTGFTSPPSQWTIEYCLKPYSITPTQTWYPFSVLDSYVGVGLFYGKSLFTGQNMNQINPYGAEGVISIDQLDRTLTLNIVEVLNPLITGKWNYIAYTHDGNVMRVYVNGQEIGEVTTDGNIINNPWGSIGITAPFPASWGASDPRFEIDEIRISNIERKGDEITGNARELLGNSFRARKSLASSDKKLVLVSKINKKKDKTKTRSGKVRKEIRLQVLETLSPDSSEARVDKDTVALFHFNGTTKDSVSKKALVGDPETIDFEDGKSGRDNSSVDFDGTDDLILVNKKLFDLPPKEFTIDFFSKPDEVTQLLPTGILTIDNGQIYAKVSYLKFPGGKTVFSAFALDAKAKPVSVRAEADFPSDKWTHLALVYKDKKLRFLINGKPYGEVDLPTLYKKGDGAINVGSDGGDGIFNGQIDELRISDVARTPSELEVYAKR